MSNFVTPKLWMAQVCDADPKAVLDLYAPKAILVPTFSRHILDTRTAMKAYFKDFFDSHPNLCGRIDSTRMQRISAPPWVTHARVYSGLYTFTWRRKKKQERERARYTFVVTEAGIIHHHSSEVPGLTIRSRPLKTKK